MTNAHGTRPVVVGVDGSEESLAAALWAVDEAVDREVPLRLVHAIGVARDRSIPFGFYAPEIRYGERALRAASSAVSATNKAVKVETDILWASPATALIAESQAAAMICVGWVGIGCCLAGRLVGSTAARVTANARCSVVVVRRQLETAVRADPGWVVVATDDRPGNDLIVAHALEEAHLRRAPVLAVGAWTNSLGSMASDELDRRVTSWRRDNPDVHIYPVCTEVRLSRFIAENAGERVQLAVVGAADADQVVSIIGPHERARVGDDRRAVMVVR